MSFGEKIWTSLFSSDVYILISAFLTVLCLLLVRYYNKKTKKEINKFEQENISSQPQKERRFLSEKRKKKLREKKQGSIWHSFTLPVNL